MVPSAARLVVGYVGLTCACMLLGCSLASSKGGTSPGPGGTGASAGGSGTGSNSGGSTSSGGSSGPGNGSGGAGLPGGGGSSASGSGGATQGTGGSGVNGTGGSGSGGNLAATGGSTSGSGSGGASSAGGTAGSSTAGGRSGSGGRSGTGAGGSAGTGSGPLGSCPSNAIFCADFESGTIPAQAAFYPEYLRATMSSYLTIDAAMGYNSTHSAKFAGTSFSQMLGVATRTSTFWTRVRLRSDVDINVNAGHATFVAATNGDGDPNTGEQIRVGEHECQLEINRRSDDKELLSNGGTYQCAGGVIFKKNTWYCLETFYNDAGSEVRVFVDGTETSLHVTDWGPYSYGMFKFGFENYSSQSRNIWYDDVAIAPQQIGCI